MKQAREEEEANASVLEGGLCFSSCQLMRSDYHKITSSSSVVGWEGVLMSAAERTLRHTGLRGRDPLEHGNTFSCPLQRKLRKWKVMASGSQGGLLTEAWKTPDLVILPMSQLHEITNKKPFCHETV